MSVFNNINLADVATLCLADGACTRPSGGVPHTFAGELKDFTFNFDANGCPTDFTLAAGAPFLYLRGLQGENTTLSITGARADSFSNLIYTKEITIEVPACEGDSLEIQNALTNTCNLVLITVDSCCNIAVHGIDVTGCGTTPLVTTSLTPLQITATDYQGGTVSTNIVKTITFGSTDYAERIPLDMDFSTIYGLRTNCL